MERKFYRIHTRHQQTLTTPRLTKLVKFNFSRHNYSAKLYISAMAYVYAGGPRSQANFGWPEALESDEYPLEIQCSKCFVDRFVLGYSSVYGSSYE